MTYNIHKSIYNNFLYFIKKKSNFITTYQLKEIFYIIFFKNIICINQEFDIFSSYLHFESNFINSIFHFSPMIHAFKKLITILLKSCFLIFFYNHTFCDFDPLQFECVLFLYFYLGWYLTSAFGSKSNNKRNLVLNDA